MMATVMTYTSLDEKKKVFDHEIINSKNDLDTCLRKYKKNESDKIFFRGCNEAKYKLYNSAQRKWIENDLSGRGLSYHETIQKIIDTALNTQNGLLRKFYSAFEQPVNDILILGFLQHYKAPTPLLDFTYSFENSLFFAKDELKYHKSGHEIDNYISVYVIDNNISNFDNHIEKIKRDAISTAQEGINNPMEYELYQSILEWETEIDYETLSKGPIALIPGYSENGIVHEIKEYSLKLLYNQQNLNTINQKGLFIFNPCEDQPLECFCQASSNWENNELIHRNKIKCLDIHKSLKKDIYSILYKQKPKITKTYIYPKEETIAKQAYQQFLKFDSIKK